jgi:hypothetical protein
MSASSDLIIQIETLQNILLARATGGGGPGDDREYRTIRAELLDRPEVAPLLPRFVTTCRDLSQFWSFIKQQFGTYHERRTYVWEHFSPILTKLEGQGGSPADAPVSEALTAFSTEAVHAVWARALERRASDPEGALTSARTLLETVCKHILDESAVPYDSAADLPKLYRLTAQQLNLAPEQHQEQIIKQILGGCHAVVEGLGAIRNKLGDAHGKGKLAAKPAPRHAELAVNLAGAVATFLINTWNAR